MGGNDIGDELEKICEAECAFNKWSLPKLRTSFCVPLAAMARSSRTTAFVAKSILLMLGSPYRIRHNSSVFYVNCANERKLIAIFDAVLYYHSQDDEDDAL